MSEKCLNAKLPSGHDRIKNPLLIKSWLCSNFDGLHFLLRKMTVNS